MRYLTIILVFLFIGCKPQQTVTKTEYVHDSIYVDRVEKIFVPQTQVVTIEKPCDSLGNLKDFKTVIKNDKANVTVEGKNGVLTAEINLDSIKEVYQKEFQSNQVEKVEIRYVNVKTPISKFWWYSLILNIILLIWVFRKYIFGLISNFFPALKLVKWLRFLM